MQEDAGRIFRQPIFQDATQVVGCLLLYQVLKNIIKSPPVTFFTGDDTCMSPGCEEADREATLETGEPHHGQNNTSHGGGVTGAVCVTQSHTLTSSPSFGFNSFLLGIQVHGTLKAHICLELEPMINFDLHPYKVDADHRFS